MEKRKRRSRVDGSPSAELNRDFKAVDLDFGTLVQQHTPYLKGVAFSILHHRDDVEEVLQDSLMKAYISLIHFSKQDRADLQARSWLATIVRNTAHTYLSRKRREISLDLLGETNYISIRSRRYDWPDPTATRIETETALAEALASLYPGERAVIMLRTYRGMSYEEVANELGIGKRTAIVYAHSARSSLRWKLQKQGIDISDLQAWDCVCEIVVDPTTPRSW